MNGTIQKKKDSRSDFQGLLFVFECIVVIISLNSRLEDIANWNYYIMVSVYLDHKVTTVTKTNG